MALDGFIVLMMMPMALLSLLLAMGSLYYERKRPGRAPQRLSWELIVRSYFGMSFGVYLISWTEAVSVGFEKQQFGYISSSEIASWIAGGALLYYVLYFSITIVVVSCVVLPLLIIRSTTPTLLQFVLIAVFIALLPSSCSFTTRSDGPGIEEFVTEYVRDLAPLLLIAVAAAGAAGLQLTDRREL